MNYFSNAKLHVYVFKRLQANVTLLCGNKALQVTGGSDTSETQKAETSVNIVA